MQWERPLNKVLKRGVYLERQAAVPRYERNRNRMTFDETITARKSIRRYSDRPIPESDVEPSSARDCWRRRRATGKT